MTPYHISLARSLLYSLLAEVRKEAVPLVDAFDVPDEILNSALGRYDGDVYTHLYQWAQRAPRNKKKVRTGVALIEYIYKQLQFLSTLRSMMCTTSTSRNC